MQFNFDPNARHSDLIPGGTLAFAVFNFREMKVGRESGGRYADIVLTIADGKYVNRKIFTMISDPMDALNSAEQRARQMPHLQHCLEAAGVLDPARPDTYAALADKSFADILRLLDGQTVAIKVGVKKEPEGSAYDDKNNVALYISSNPKSSTANYWKKLVAQTQGSDGESLSQVKNSPIMGRNVTGGSPAGAYDWLQKD